MPLELLACPKCRGEASEYDKNKWRCLKCGQRFIYTSPDLAPAQVAPPQAAPAGQTTTIVREVYVYPTITAAQPVQPARKRSGPLGWFTVLLWLAGIGLFGWAMADHQQRVGYGVLSLLILLLAVAFSVVWGLRAFFRLFRR